MAISEGSLVGDYDLNDWQSFKEKEVEARELLLLSHILFEQRCSMNTLQTCLNLSTCDLQNVNTTHEDRLPAVQVEQRNVHKILYVWWKKVQLKVKWETLLSCIETLENSLAIINAVRGEIFEGTHDQATSEKHEILICEPTQESNPNSCEFSEFVYSYPVKLHLSDSDHEEGSVIHQSNDPGAVVRESLVFYKKLLHSTPNSIVLIRKDGVAALSNPDLARVKEVRVNMKKHQRKFASLLRKAYVALHSTSAEGLSVFLAELCADIKGSIPFFEKRALAIISRSTIEEIFLLLSEMGAWDFINYEILESVISEFKLKDLKQPMDEHKANIATFMDETALSDYLTVWDGSREMRSLTDRAPVIAKLKGKWGTYTLAKVAEKQCNLASGFRLKPIVLQFEKAAPGCEIELLTRQLNVSDAERENHGKVNTRRRMKTTSQDTERENHGKVVTRRGTKTTSQDAERENHGKVVTRRGTRTTSQDAERENHGKVVTRRGTKTTSQVMITEHPQLQQKKFGEKVTFSVNANGIGEQLTYQWKKDDDDITYSTLPCCEGATTSVLSIACALSLYEGQYKCLVSNELSEVESQTAQLHVLRISGPKLTKEELELISKMLNEEEIAHSKLKLIDFSDQSLTFQEVCDVLHSLDIGKHVIEKLTSELDNLKYFQAYHLALQRGVNVSIRYFKLLFYGPPCVGKTSARRRIIGEILNLKSARSRNPETEIEASSNTGAEETWGGSHVIVQVDEQKHGRTAALLTSTTDELMPCKWNPMYIKKFNECDLDDELVLLYRFIHEVTPISSTESQPIPGDDQISNHDGTYFLNPAKPVCDSARNELVSSSPSSNVTKEAKIDLHDTPALSVTTQQKSVLPAGGYSDETYMYEKTIHSKLEPSWKRVFKAFNNVLKSKNSKDYLNVLLKGTSLINMIDTGGQPAFLEMLPVLTVGPAMYLVFLNLLQKLNDRYEVPYATTKEGDNLLGTSSITIKEVIFQILSSIVAFTHINGNEIYRDSPQAVLIVGTHKDKLDSTADVVEKDEALQRELKQVLQSAICSEFLCRASDSDKSLVLAIDNETGNQDEVQAIRKRLEEIIESKFEKYDIPAAWLMFNLFLQKLAQNNIHENSTNMLCSMANVGVIPLKQCRDIAMELHVTDLENALWFFHHIVGSLMYFPEVKELEDIVICDPQVVFDSVTTLIIQTFNTQSDDTASQRFKETGQFSYKKIENAVRGTSCDFLSPAKLICLLEYRNIIAPIEAPPHSKSSKWYFFPAILKCATNEQLQEFERAKKPNDPPPLMIHFKFGFVPMGLFCAVIAKLVSQIHSQNLGWLLHCDADAKLNKPLYKNMLTFRTGATYNVTLISQPKRFEVHLTQTQTENTENSHYVTAELDICKDVLLAICDTLDKVISLIKHLHLTTSTTKEPIYQLGFKCPLHSDSDDLLLNKATSDSSRSPKLLWNNFLSNKSCFQCLNSEGKLSKNEVLNPKFLNCLVWFGISNLNSLKLLLITEQPESQVKMYGDEVSFKVKVSVTGIEAENTDSFHYQWFKDNTKITLETHPYCRGADESTLYINAVLAQYEGKYKCKICRQEGTDSEFVCSNDATLKVVTPISWLLDECLESLVQSGKSIMPPVFSEPHCRLLPLIPPKREVVDHTGKMILDDGITINVPPGAVVNNDSICVQIQSFVPASNETIVLPQGLKLLSPVYHISTSGKNFQKEVQLSMLHYAKLLTRKDVSELKFLHCTDKTPPYRFTELRSGHAVFDFDSCSGTVHLKSFCEVGVGGSNRIEEKYCAFFTHPIDPTLKPYPKLTSNLKCMHAMFSVCYDHGAFNKLFESEMENKFAEPFYTVNEVVELASDCREFELTIPHKDIKELGYVVKSIAKTTKILFKDLPSLPPPESAKSPGYPIPGALPRRLLQVKLFDNQCTKVGNLECILEVMCGTKKEAEFQLSANPPTYTDREHYQALGMTVDTDIVTIDDWSEISRYLLEMDQHQIKRLGGELGLRSSNLQWMSTLPDDMVNAWLRKEDTVKKKCGDPLTWGVLVKALKTIGQTGIADKIDEDKCKPNGSAAGITSIPQTPIVENLTQKKTHHSSSSGHCNSSLPSSHDDTKDCNLPMGDENHCTFL